MEISEPEIQRLTLPWCREANWYESLPAKLNQLEPGPTELDCRDWQLGCKDLQQLSEMLEKTGITITRIQAIFRETIVSAAALGYQSYLVPQQGSHTKVTSSDTQPKSNTPPKLLFHEGTLRSGDHLSAEGDVLLLGDVNPGARISAGGDVMVWGRLRGVAHAGQDGDTQAKIVALQLRPLQLRIADAVARGPEDQPQAGLAEEARIDEGGAIMIEPASTKKFNG
ncbi:MAG TPA: septum site-determining protein MinC [Prochlorococcus sp.]|jgi:septum site-determining protein MinC|nr:septum site-determining protein MinC [Prochlorococcaceae cyanobacterium ETNP2_MAG_10]MDP6197083.1 septum site-determining protein MinC [Prochlorococcaceae cyanobacterium ETNP18_MAG_17]MDP6321603.1 septum site-determining protein MinC [Prochlorococcaceae cyanobacterium ETNP14_MAG_5]MDP7327393.1 septum site-determining protein MinC [Prochlorococcaceae cyanobacterium ETNP7_MAG_30]HJL68266.1 septum site-determining protein MinC [Prochlorococcaceae cyanobacterium Gl_MAG_24]|tara:strand:- start:1730 stop:2404 length:675 start_codon:yes stop_codon:yes gene_type:complete